MNKAILMGNITQDITVKTSANGVAISNTGLATNEQRKDKATGTVENITTFHNLVAFGHSANFLAKRFKKGDKILIEGKISNRSWDKDDGTKGYKSEIIVDQMHFAGGKKEKDEFEESDQKHDVKPVAKKYTPPARAKTEEEINIEDIPF